MLTSLLISVATLTGSPTVTWEAPPVYVDGLPFQVSVEITMADGASSMPTWLLTPGAFTLDGKPLSDLTTKESVPMPAGTTLSLSFDMASAIKSSKNFKGAGFRLGFNKEFSKAEPLAVRIGSIAPKGLNLMEMPAANLAKSLVVMETNQGTMMLEFWPDAAPGHVRNFLDLSYTGFYDGLTFHRVIPGFMIQGGDPTGTGSGGSTAPRTLKGEFSKDDKYKHVRGVLSMARTNDPNSATCQFFVMHGPNSGLDGSYSAFGKCIYGMEAVDQIVNTPRDPGDRPLTKQIIKKTTVVVLQ